MQQIGEEARPEQLEEHGLEPERYRPERRYEIPVRHLPLQDAVSAVEHDGLVHGEERRLAASETKEEGDRHGSEGEQVVKQPALDSMDLKALYLGAAALNVPPSLRIPLPIHAAAMKELSGILALCVLATGSAFADLVDPRLYTPAPGDAVIDSGVMNVSRLGQAISSEEFRIIRRADGGRTIVSMVTAADGSFEIPARWDYDANEQATGAVGWGKHADERAFEVTLARDGDAATMSVAYESGERVTHEGECPPGCLMDMMPGAMPQFTMSRRYDADNGGVQEFRWMAFILNQDMRSFDVVVSVDHAQDLAIARADGSEITVRHYVFDEKGSLDGTGEEYEAHSNLWVDATHRPIKFKVGQTIGLRAGFEDIDDQLTPR